LLIAHPNAVQWSTFYLVTTSISATYALIAVCRRLGLPRLGLGSLTGDLREGFYFSVSLSSQSIYNNIDKTMMVRLATLEAAGVYATAYRVLDVAFQPVSSLLYSTYAKFFQHGALGIRGATRYARRLLPYALAYGAVASTLLFAMAPLLPLVIGKKFVGADEALRWLSPIVLFRVIHYLFSNSLTGANFQGLRCGLQVGVAAVNAILNLWLIPAYSWRGAAWASLVSDGLLAVSVCLATVLLMAREKLPEPIPEAQTQGTM
jgi:O-antigen/teichoic acid export membrane protein